MLNFDCPLNDMNKKKKEETFSFALRVLREEKTLLLSP